MVTFAEFCWSVVASVILVAGGRLAWYVYQLRETVIRLTAENQRMRRYLRNQAQGDDLPFLPLGRADD